MLKFESHINMCPLSLCAQDHCCKSENLNLKIGFMWKPVEARNVIMISHAWCFTANRFLFYLFILSIHSPNVNKNTGLLLLLLMFENAELRRVHKRGCRHLLEACGGFSQTEWPLQFTQLCALRNSHVVYLQGVQNY